MYVCMYVCMYKDANSSYFTLANIYMYVCIYVCMCVLHLAVESQSICTHIFICTHIYIYTYIYMYIHIRYKPNSTKIYIHTYMNM